MEKSSRRRISHTDRKSSHTIMNTWKLKPKTRDYIILKSECVFRIKDDDKMVRNFFKRGR